MPGGRNAYELIAKNHCRSYAELLFRVWRWLDGRRTPTTWRDLVDQFGCNRATAFRWLSAWHAANGTTGTTKETT